MTPKATITMRGNSETKQLFVESFEASGANSHGEFLQKMLDKWNSPDVTIAPEIRTVPVEIEKRLLPNELILSLTPAQLFALSNLVLGESNFAEKQNEIIDRLKGVKPWFSGSNLYDTEFKNVWVRNTVISKTMTPEERETAIKHNMAAYLVNMFLVNLIEEVIEHPGINLQKLKNFIRSQAAPAKPVEPLKPQPNEPTPLNS